MKSTKPTVQRKARHFQGIPIREARGDILVQPLAQDIDKATIRDPENCVYARAVKRILNTQHAFVYSNVAYIEVMDEHGDPLMERYLIRNSAREAVDHFDKTGEWKKGGFVLHKPNKAYTLEAKFRYGRRWAAANVDKVNLYQKRYYAKQKAKRRSPNMKQLNGVSFRDGTGCVRFLGTHNGHLATRRA